MNHDTPNALQKVMERRRLLRGTFAVPAVLTLASGSALAAQSSARAIAYLAANPQAPTSTDDLSTKAYVRVKRYTKRDKNGKISEKWINGAEVAAWIPNYVLRGNATAREVVNGIPTDWARIDSGKKGATVYGNAQNGMPSEVAHDGWVALRISYSSYGGKDTIQIVGVSDDGNGYAGTSAMTASAWTSFVSGP